MIRINLLREKKVKRSGKGPAIVNGHEIKISEVQMATDDIIGQLPDLPPKLRYPFVVEFLVERHLMAQLAVKEGVADSAAVLTRDEDSHG